MFNNTLQLLHATETRISNGDTGMQLKYDYQKIIKKQWMLTHYKM